MPNILSSSWKRWHFGHILTQDDPSTEKFIRRQIGKSLTHRTIPPSLKKSIKIPIFLWPNPSFRCFNLRWSSRCNPKESLAADLRRQLTLSALSTAPSAASAPAAPAAKAKAKGRRNAKVNEAMEVWEVSSWGSIWNILYNRISWEYFNGLSYLVFIQCYYIGTIIMHIVLVGGLEHEFYFFHSVGNFIIPTDELIFFRGVQTTNQMGISWEYFNGFIYSWEVPQQEGPPSTAIFYPEHGWEIAEVNGGLFIAMFDCWRVSNINWLFMLPHPTTKLQI